MVPRKKALGNWTENDLERGFVKHWLNTVWITRPSGLQRNFTFESRNCIDQK